MRGVRCSRRRQQRTAAAAPVIPGRWRPVRSTHLLAALLSLLLCDLGRRSERQLLAVAGEVLERHFGGPPRLLVTNEHCRKVLGCPGKAQRLPEGRAATGRRAGHTQWLGSVSSDQCSCNERRWRAEEACMGTCCARPAPRL